MTQKDAVFSAVTAALSEAGITFSTGTTDAGTVLTKTIRAQINAMLVKQFSSTEIELSPEAKTKLANITELRAYVSGLVSNWTRKDPRLNGGKKESPKKRVTNTSDAQIKAMRQLMRAKTDPADRAEIQSFIDKRITELTPTL